MSNNHETHAVHAKNGDLHIVGVDALRVMIVKDGNSWFAQGLEIDYAAAGATIEETKNNFSNGLMLTINEHLKMHGTIEHLLTVAPQEAWKEFFHSKSKMIQSEYGTLQIHDLSENEEIDDLDFPFSELLFMSSAESQKEAA